MLIINIKAFYQYLILKLKLVFFFFTRKNWDWKKKIRCYKKKFKI